MDDDKEYVLAQINDDLRARIVELGQLTIDQKLAGQRLMQRIAKLEAALKTAEEDRDMHALNAEADRGRGDGLEERIAKLEAYIARNCDPFDMTVEDAEFFKTVNPYALEKSE